MDDVITLIEEIYEEDELKQSVLVEEKKTEIFCERCDIARSEWVAAGQNNIKASLMVKTAKLNYEGQTIAIVDGKRRKIYRTFVAKDSDEIELYMKDEAGT